MATSVESDQIDLAARLIRFVGSGNVVAFTGAGISTDSGIPDFRSPESGVWTHVDALAVASIYGFRRDPEQFYKWVRSVAATTRDAAPNPAHHALARLESLGWLRAIITQNIDALHSRAGSKRIFELHGNLRGATCISCYQGFDGEPIMAKFLRDGLMPRCTTCGGVLKPNVILFGEQLPVRELQGAQEAVKQCRLMLIVGSSLEVAPANELPNIAKRFGAKLVIVNLEPTPADHQADVVIRGRAAEALPAIVTRLEE
jgi:NAD-dependent deacetylase